MSQNTNSGTSILGLLGVAFVVLKLTKVIDWSWWFVTMPFWIGLPIIILIAIVLVIKDKSQLSEDPVKKTSVFQERLQEAMRQQKEMQNKYKYLNK